MLRVLVLAIALPLALLLLAVLALEHWGGGPIEVARATSAP